MGSEYHILLRLPDEVAALVEASPPSPVEIVFDPPADAAVLPPPCGETATFRVGERRFRSKLMALPTVVETHKSMDRTDYIKTGHVGQMLVVAADEAELPAGVELRDGLAPPCAQIRERKWRRRPVRDRREVEQVVVELESVLKGSLPKPEYEMVEIEVDVTDDENGSSEEGGEGMGEGSEVGEGSVFGEGSQAEPMQVDGDESNDAGARPRGSVAGDDTSGAQTDLEDASTDASTDASRDMSMDMSGTPSRAPAQPLPLRLILPRLPTPTPTPAAPAPPHRGAIPTGVPAAVVAPADPPRPGILKLKLPVTAAASKSGSAAAAGATTGAAAKGAPVATTAAAAAEGAPAAAAPTAAAGAFGLGSDAPPGDEAAALQAALRAAQQRSIKASAEMAALQAAPPPTNPLLRARQQTQFDALKRQRAEADLESAALQQRLEGKADTSEPKPKGRKGKR